MHLTGAAARNDLKVTELDLERDRAAANAGALAIAPDLVDNLSKRIPRHFVGEEIGGKRVLGPNGFAYPVGADGPLVDPARRPVIVGTRLSEMLLKELQGLARKVAPCFDTVLRALSN